MTDDDVNAGSVLFNLSELVTELADQSLDDAAADVLSGVALIERLTAENARLQAEVERLTPKPMTLQEVAKTFERIGYKGVEWNANKVCVFSYGGNGITLGGMEATWIAQGLLRDADPIAVQEPARREDELDA